MNIKEYSTAPVICRLCLSDIEFQLPIFGEEGQSLGIYFKLQSCFPALQMIQDDGLPDTICYRCLFSLDQTYEFWTKCFTSETILRNSHVKRNWIRRHKYQALQGQSDKEQQKRMAVVLQNTQDDSDNDEWFIWDANYKITQNENKSSHYIPGNAYNETSKQSNVSERFGNFHLKNQNTASWYKNDSLPDASATSQKKDVTTFINSNKSIPSLHTNFSSNFWKQNSLQTMNDKQLCILQTSMYSPRLKYNEIFSQSSEQQSSRTADSKLGNKKGGILNQYEYHNKSTDFVLNAQKNHQSLLKTRSYDDMWASATNLLQRFRANNK